MGRGGLTFEDITRHSNSSKGRLMALEMACRRILLFNKYCNNKITNLYL